MWFGEEPNDATFGCGCVVKRSSPISPMFVLTLCFPQCVKAEMSIFAQTQELTHTNKHTHTHTHTHLKQARVRVLTQAAIALLNVGPVCLGTLADPLDASVWTWAKANPELCTSLLTAHWKSYLAKYLDEFFRDTSDANKIVYSAIESATKLWTPSHVRSHLQTVCCLLRN